MSNDKCVVCGVNEQDEYSKICTQCWRVYTSEDSVYPYAGERNLGQVIEWAAARAGEAKEAEIARLKAEVERLQGIAANTWSVVKNCSYCVDSLANLDDQKTIDALAQIPTPKDGE